MPQLIFLLAAIALLGAYLALLQWETNRGTRVFASARARFDENIARAAFVAQHVDWSAYASEQLRAFSLWLSHETAHLTLRFVRFIERLLSRTVRQLRAKAESEVAPAEPARPFLQALSDFKEELQNTRPEDLGNPPE